jgi:hypothetical protein
MGELIEFLDKRDVDGFIVTSRGQAVQGSPLAEALADTRALIRSSRWENFSRLLEDSYGSREAMRAGSEGAYEEGD